MISAGILVCLCLVSAFNYFRQRRQRKFIANLKGPFAWPLVGSVHKIVFLTPKNFFQKSAKYLSKYGTFTRIWIFHRLFIPVADLELAKQLLQSESHLETGNDWMKNWLGGGVLTCQPDQWAQRHQRLAAFFQSDYLLQIKKLIQEQAEKPHPELMEHVETRQVFNVWKVMSTKVLDFILATTCGVHPSDQYKQAFSDLTEVYRQRFLSMKSANRIIFWIASPFMRRRQQRLIRQINNENKQILEQCRQSQLENNQAKNGAILIDRIECTKKLEHQSLIDVLSGSENLSDEQLFADLNTCNFLGYLLCSTTLCFALILIARHPSVQQRCLEELQISLNEKEKNMQGLPYLEAVLKETLRLHPPQLIVGRHLTQDFPYTHSKVGDASLPIGSEVYINLYEIQRSEELHGQNANLFQPDRYLGNATELFSYGIGPRGCPAQQFSLTLLKSLLAPFLLQYELLPYGDAVRQDLKLTPGSRNGFQLAVKLRSDSK